MIRSSALVLATLCAGALAAPGPAAVGELLVGNKSDDTVWRLSLEDGRRLGEIATAPGPHEIAVSPDGRLAVVTGYGGAQPGNRLTLIDTAAGSASGEVDLGEHARPHGVRFTPDGGRLLVTTEDSGALVVVDVQSRTVERAIDVGKGVGHMVALSRDGAVAYVSKIAAGTVVRVDLADGATLERPAGGGAEGLEVAPDGSVWVGNREDGTVTVHDPGTLAVRAILQSPGFPIRVVFTADGRHALVTNARAGTLAVFDAASCETVAEVALADPDREYRDTMLGRAALPIGALAHPDPAVARVYVAISGGNEIAVVDSRTWSVVARWRTGNEPDALGIVGAAPPPALP
ncbi:gluconolaconase [Luteimonas sp. SJ-92]|uniref:Gluconolaconase n=1 Tax=Luteimonas salinisoli TaxID=2752307 RepID=A0A853JFH6_9GAMM|nr:gluconolaconase [Luteimonas salinisoli]NZA27514.1 gluconolaconase [Luteimonas salinisoli]